MASLDNQLSRLKSQLTRIEGQVTRCKASNDFEELEKLNEEQQKLMEEQEKEPVEELEKLMEEQQKEPVKRLKEAEEKLTEAEERRREQEKERVKEQKKRKEAEQKLMEADQKRRKEPVQEQKKLKEAEEKRAEGQSMSSSYEERGDSPANTSSGVEIKPVDVDEADESLPLKRHFYRKLRSTLQNTEAHKLNLDDAPFASGASSGNVCLGDVEGQRVAIKLAPKTSRRVKKILNEVQAYTKLRKCWGLCMPRLVDYGKTVHGGIIYIATEFIIGSSIGQNCVTPEVAMAARKGLQAIHMSGILHGYIREKNILVVGSGVRFVDFGFARSSTSTAECKRELEQLEAIMTT